MSRRIATATGVMLLAAATLPADFSYQEKSTITGGAMAAVMKVAGVFSSKAREPISGTVAVKGDRMSHRNQYSTTIIDLQNQTITTVDMQKKSYSVMTFDEMRQLLAELGKKGKKEGSPDVSIKVSADNTGKTRQIGGLDTKELIIHMEMEASDPNNKDQKGSMAITTDMWLASGVAGYAEVRDFQKRMAEKLNWAPGGNMFMSNPDVMKGMAEVTKEMGKIEGVPVFQTITMGAAGMPAGSTEQTANTAGAPAQAERPSVEGAAGNAAGSTAGNKAGGRLGGAVGGSVGGALGRLGGFGRKKQAEPKPEEQAQQQAPAEPSAPQAAPGTLLQMQTEMSGFSQSADSSLFEIPAGFKKVDSDLKRMPR